MTVGPGILHGFSAFNGKQGGSITFIVGGLSFVAVDFRNGPEASFHRFHMRGFSSE